MDTVRVRIRIMVMARVRVRVRVCFRVMVRIRVSMRVGVNVRVMVTVVTISIKTPISSCMFFDVCRCNTRKKFPHLTCRSDMGFKVLSTFIYLSLSLAYSVDLCYSFIVYAKHMSKPFGLK